MKFIVTYIEIDYLDYTNNDIDYPSFIVETDFKTREFTFLEFLEVLKLEWVKVISFEKVVCND